MEVLFNGQRYAGDPISTEGLWNLPIPESDRAILKEAREREAEFQETLEKFKRGELVADNSPERAFKNIVVNGEVLATVYVTGVTSMSIDAVQKLASLGLKLPSGGQGTPMQAAIARVEFLAKALGGEIKDAVKPKASSSKSSPPAFSTFSSFSPSIRHSYVIGT
ncbi:hypothetical protein [Achromobacter sp.]|uniref:hypothetical protein n=1 Tax=Achromobacter sp. TaxID=134375 RepID=UPI003C730E33